MPFRQGKVRNKRLSPHQENTALLMLGRQRERRACIHFRRQVEHR
jgi:hypothetical protein